jgi:predicted Zn-dependent peptidase
MDQIHYELFTLDNGLRVVVHEDHSVPKVVLNIIYRVGSKDEQEDRTGFAHLFEHLMFGGSANIPSYDVALQRVGGENNAYTTTDVTNYYLTLPSHQAESAFWLESDRMLELDFSQRSLDVQKSVVIEEFKQRYLNKPYGDAHLLLRAEAYKVHPYRWPTIGREIAHIEGAQLEHVKDFFYGFYAPNNATLVVAGDITLEEAKRLSEKWFGPIPRRELRKRPLPQEPAQTEARSATVHRDVPLPAIFKMYHIAGRGEAAYYPADFLTDVLSFGKASHLYQVMVKERQVASGIRAFSWGAHDPGVISIDGTVARGRTVEEYESALQEVLEELQQLADSEVSRVKAAIEMHYVLEQTQLLNRAMQLAIADSLGDITTVNTSLAQYLALQTAELRSAAARILHPSNCSTLYYLPQA